MSLSPKLLVLAFVARAGAVLSSIHIVLGYLSPFQILPPVTNGLLLNANVAGNLLLLAVLSMMGEFVVRPFSTLGENPRCGIREALRREWKPDRVVGRAGTGAGAPTKEDDSS